MRKITSLESQVFNAHFIRRVTAVLSAGVVLLIAGEMLFLSLAPESLGFIRRQFSLDSEGNLATWYNSTLLLLVALTAFVVAWIVEARIEDPGERRIDVAGWIGIGALFLYLSIDDAAGVHDSMAWPLRRTMESTSLPFLSELGRSTWVAFFVALGVVTIGCMLFFFRRNLWRVRRALFLVLLGVMLFSLVPLAEVMENKLVERFGRAYGLGVSIELRQTDVTDWAVLQLLIIVEEASEMFGAICFLAAFLVFGQSALQVPPKGV